MDALIVGRVIAGAGGAGQYLGLALYITFGPFLGLMNDAEFSISSLDSPRCRNDLTTWV